jgi:predicted transposase YdaD
VLKYQKEGLLQGRLEGREEGRAEGHAEGRDETIAKLVAAGFDREQIEAALKDL